jgi:hypothetical protein
MKTVSLAVVATALCLSACNRPIEAGAGGPHARGRYSGVGIYRADRMWPQMAAAAASKDAAPARLRDDEEIIVVVDSQTGEIRQCGNLSGYCIGMSPWARPLVGPQLAPVPLIKHDEDFQREADAAKAKASSSATVKSEPSKAASKP